MNEKVEVEKEAVLKEGTQITQVTAILCN